MAWSMYTLDTEGRLLRATAMRYDAVKYAGLVSCDIVTGGNRITLAYTTVEQMEQLARCLLEAARELRGDMQTVSEPDDVVDAEPASGTVVRLRADAGIRGRCTVTCGRLYVVKHGGGIPELWNASKWMPVP